MTTSTLLLCRSEKKSLEFQRAVQERLNRKVRTVISPAFEIEFLEIASVSKMMDHLVFTSTNGVIGAKRNGLTSASHVYCVGNATASEAIRQGYRTKSANGDVNDLADLILSDRPKGSMAHVSGEHVAGDLVSLLKDKGTMIERMIAYRQKMLRPNQEFLVSLAGNEPKVLPLFSPRSTQILRGEIIGENTYIIAMSASVAESLDGRCKFDVTVAAGPNFQSMLDATCSKLVS